MPTWRPGRLASPSASRRRWNVTTPHASACWPCSKGQGELFAQPDYRGCAFARASAESHPGDLAEQAAQAYRRWVRTLLTDLAAQAGVPEPEVLARQLHLLYDGSGQAARMDHDPAAAAAARAAAATLLDAAMARGTAARLSG